VICCAVLVHKFVILVVVVTPRHVSPGRGMMALRSFVWP
jgi:hypothetical protein